MIAYDKFTGERLAVLETDLPAGPPDYVQLEAGFYHPHRNTLFALTSEGNVHEIDPSSGESLNSFAVPFQNLGGGFATDPVGTIRLNPVTGNLLVSEQRPHFRIFEMTPTGDLVQTVDRPAFSSVDNEGSSAAPSFVIDPSTGTAYVVVGDVFSNIKIFGFDGFPKQSQVEAIVAGDVNGDGLDDLLVTDRGFVTYRADSGLDNVGRSYIITGRDLAGGISLLQDSHQIIQARNMGERGAALGDLDGDGYDDFAVTRSVENGQDQIGSAFVYYGSGDRDDVIVDAAQSADIVYVRPDVQSLSSGQAWVVFRQRSPEETSMVMALVISPSDCRRPFASIAVGRSSPLTTEVGCWWTSMHSGQPNPLYLAMAASNSICQAWVPAINLVH